MRTGAVVVLSWILLLCSFATMAQLNADFTVNVTVGCSPLDVVFTDQSTGFPTSWQWTLWSGNQSSQQNPTAIFVDPGTYDIMLIISNGITTDTLIKTNYITVLESPVPGFISTSGNTGCAPYDVHFQDQSTAQTAITQWLWDFGDGATSSNQNPLHIFNDMGSFQISLQVWDSQGCSSNLTKNNYIDVLDPPIANFPDQEFKSCSPPVNVNFTNTSSHSGSLNYFWDFGDGITSTAFEPSHSYTTYGQFNVTLIVSTANGCTDTLIRPNMTEILAVNASFTTDNNIYCKSDSIEFDNTTLGGDTYLWNFGDGNTSTDKDPDHSYPNAGIYTVTLNVSLSTDNCTDSYSKVITVEQIIANFSAAPSYGCEIPHVVTYTDLSTNAYSWEWHLGNGQTSTSQNPVASYGITDSLKYQKKDNFNDTLIVTSPNGCTDRKIIYSSIKIRLMNPFFIESTDKGCAPLPVNFTNFSNYFSSYDAITNIDWDFGDGNTASGIFVSNTFGVGVFNTSLTITTAAGCDTTITHKIMAGTGVTASYQQDDTVTCASDKVCFWDDSGDPAINTWSWELDIGKIQDTMSILCTEFVDTGWAQLTYMAGNNGCFDTLVVDSAVYVKGPYANILKDSSSCANPLDYRLFSTVTGADRWYWDFDDGSYDSTFVDTLDHTFPSSGDYFVTLEAFNDLYGCTSADTFAIPVRKLVADFSMTDPIGCKGHIVTFDGGISENEKTYKYRWNWGDGSPVVQLGGPVTSHQYPLPGIYVVKLRVEDVNWCRDSISKTVRIFQPIPDFIADATAGCAPFTVNFSDLSTADTTIAQWEWFIDDTLAYTGNSLNHEFISIGGHNVELKVTDAEGCINTMVKSNYVTVSQPATSFTTLDTLICIGDSVHFVAPPDYLYDWNFGDGNNSTNQNPVHYYADSGFYSISLLAVDSLACDSMVLKANYIHVQKPPVALFDVDTLYSDCYPLEVHFADSTDDLYLDKWRWTFGDGIFSSFQNPSHNYTYPGLYTVQLVVTTSGGCIDTLTKTNLIEINGPTAGAKVEPDSICSLDVATFILENQDGVSFIKWNYGDGLEDTVFSDTVIHAYIDSGWHKTVVTFGDSLGVCRVGIDDSIYVSKVVANFSTDNESYCVQFGIPFADQSDNTEIWDWDFGDGSSSSLQEPVYAYPIAGIYDVRLIASINFGCSDTILKTIEIVDKPALSLSNDTSMCFGDSLQLTASGTEFYSWNPSTWLSSDSSSSIQAFPDSNITYYVTYFDSAYTCNLNDSVKVNVLILPEVSLANDTSICERDTIPIDAGSGFDGYAWSTGDSIQTISAWQNDTILAIVQGSNGCWSLPDTIIIHIDSLPIVSIGQDTTICAEENITFNAGFGFVLYEWHDSSIGQTFTTGNADTIYVTITDTNSCRNTSDTVKLAILTLPVVILQNDTTICDRDTITINCPDNFNGYFWSTNDTTKSILVWFSDTIILNVLSSDNCLSLPDTVITSIYQLPVVNLGNDTSICFEDSIVFSADPGYVSYNWYNFQNTQSIYLLPDTSHYVWLSVLDSNSCTSLVDSLYLTVDSLPVVFLGSDTSICNGEVLIVDAGFGYNQYEWWDSTGNQTISIEIADTVYGRVQNSYGCWSHADSLIVSIFELPETAIPDVEICRNAIALITSPDGYTNYLWSTLDTSQNIAISPTQNQDISLVVTDSNDCNSLPDTLTIIVHQLPEIELGNDTSICDHDTIFLSVDSTFEGYQWSDASSNPGLSVTAADTVWLTVESEDLCWSIPDTIVIGINSLPIINLGNDTSICVGNSLSLTLGSQFLSYSWSTGETDSVISVSTGDTVLVYVVDSNNCNSNTDQLILTIDSLPVANIGVDTVVLCIFDSVLFNASPGFEIYSWSIGDNTQQITVYPQSTETIYLNVSDINGCTSLNDSVLLIVHSLPVTTLEDSILICPWDTIYLDGGESLIEYHWSTGYIGQILTVNFEDQITLWVKDTNNCISISDTSVVTFDSIPEIRLGSDTTVCEGLSLILDPGAGFLDYEWHDNSGDHIFEVTEADTVWVTILTTASCRSYSDTIIITFFDRPVINIGNDTNLCYLNGFILDAGEGFDGYFWSDSSDNQILTYYPTVPGFVYAQAKDSNNCWSLPDSLFYDVKPAPYFNIIDSMLICPGKDTLLDAGPGYQAYYWSTGDSSQTTRVASGTYIATVTNGTCEAYDTVLINLVDLSLEVGPDTVLCDGESMELDADNQNAFYRWSTGEVTPQITIFPGVHTYTVEVTKLFCTLSDSIYVDRCSYWPEHMIDLPNAFSPNGDGYNDRLRVLGYYIDGLELMIYDRYGKLIYHCTNVDEAMNKGWDGTYNGMLQETDVYVYYLSATFTDGSQTALKGNITLIK